MNLNGVTSHIPLPPPHGWGGKSADGGGGKYPLMGGRPKFEQNVREIAKFLRASRAFFIDGGGANPENSADGGAGAPHAPP